MREKHRNVYLDCAAVHSKRQQSSNSLHVFVNPARLVLASSGWQRMRGMFAWDTAPVVLLIAPCRSIHTFGMHSSLDIAFVSAEGVVMKSCRAVEPNCIKHCRKAAGVLERCASSEAWPGEGDSLSLAAFFQR